MDKLTEQVGLKLSHDQHRQLIGLADMASESVSEYVRGIVMAHLEEKVRQFESMRRVFGTQENLGTSTARDR
jgi:hypothetical protein